MNTDKGLKSKEMLKEAAEKKVKIKFNDRVKIQITSDNMRHFRKGDILSPHRVVAEKYISDKLAKEVKK